MFSFLRFVFSLRCFSLKQRNISEKQMLNLNKMVKTGEKLLLQTDARKHKRNIKEY